MSESLPGTKATRKLLQDLQANLIGDARALQALERFPASEPKAIQVPTAIGSAPEYSYLPTTMAYSPFRKLAQAQSNSVKTYLTSSFPSLDISPKGYVATRRDPVDGRMVIHYAIDDALLDPSDDPLVRFLVVVVAIHNLGHSLRKAFWAYPGEASAMDAYPYYHEDCAYGIYEENGFAAEIALFGGIMGVVFKDEQDPRLDKGTFPFHKLNFRGIAYFCITPPPREKSTETPPTYKIDNDMIAARMNSSNWFDIFDHNKLVTINTPSFFRHRLCAVLNSTHLVRPDAAIHASDGQTIRTVFDNAGPIPKYTRRRRCVPRRARGASNGAASLKPSL
ncbi:hypothetical protein DFH06DRAFT_695156 [Mycena polygramma]|nr:hypothetical protein DFH06DRAFT_695156 [Mycena polygramma]